ncbi:MAG TPA: hypothetical protein VLJ88_06665 [Propionibacteriaceae bacterium]|nr:hypothetical protein [Propionibacteriaceae bacterium]
MPRRALVALLAASVLALAGCGANADGDPAASPSASAASPTRASASAPPTSSPTPKPSKSSNGLPEADPAFTKHFDAKFYTSLNNDYAPFGFPEQADILRAWDSRRDQLGDCSTVAEMAAADKVKIKKLVADGEDGDPDADTIVIAYGYALPYLTGQIDSDGKKMLTLAIQRLRTFYAENDVREFRVMLSDLKSFPATDC